jgi:lycopene cyclase domain-containing protein
MSLYLWIIILSFAGPFFLSFDKKIAFYKEWRFVFPSILLIAIIFIFWDEWFSETGVWGFNAKYVQGIYFGKLPLEEILFFIVIPYNCLFIHVVLKGYFPNLNLNLLAKIFTFIFSFSALLLSLFNLDNYYTLSASLIAFLLMGGVILKTQSWFPRFVFTYLVCLIPFIIVNGILTGQFTKDPVVWYSEAHIVGLRLGTIPVEDLFYNFCLMLPIIWIYEGLKNSYSKK